MIQNHLHVGFTNVIAREFGRFNVKTTKFGDFKNHLNSRTNSVSISAFNPSNKSTPWPDQAFEHSLIETIPKEMPLLYFSTMRVGGQSKKHQHYASNKKMAEDLLLNYFENLTILRLPNLVDSHSEVLSKFQKIIREGIKSGDVIFDCDRKSEWIFLSSNSLVSYCTKIIKNREISGQTIRCVSSPHKISAEDIANFCSKHFVIKTIKYGTDKLEYDAHPSTHSIYSNETKNEILSLLLGRQN